MTEVALIVNPHARRFRRESGLIESLRRHVAGRATIHVTDDIPALDRIARTVVASGCTTIVLAGGDGTFCSGVTAFARASRGPLPRFVFAPAGTVATVARNFGHRADLHRTIERVLSDPGSLPATVRPTLEVRENDGVVRLGFTVGTGLVARFFERYEAAGAGGQLAALRIVLRVFWGSFFSSAYARSVLDPLPCTITVQDTVLPARAFSLVVCSVLPDLGLHMRVTYRGGTDHQRPHLVASPLPASALGPQWPRVTLGRRLAGNGNYDDLVERFRIDFGGVEAPYVLDGDIFHARALAVRAGPEIDVVSL